MIHRWLLVVGVTNDHYCQITTTTKRKRKKKRMTTTGRDGGSKRRMVVVVVSNPANKKPILEMINESVSLD